MQQNYTTYITVPVGSIFLLYTPSSNRGTEYIRSPVYYGGGRKELVEKKISVNFKRQPSAKVPSFSFTQPRAAGLPCSNVPAKDFQFRVHNTICPNSFTHTLSVQRGIM